MGVDAMHEMEEDYGPATTQRPGIPDLLFITLASTLTRNQQQSQPSGDSTTDDTWLWKRRMGGRWLIAHRLRCNIPLALIVDRTRIDASTLQLLEQGLVDPGAISEPQLIDLVNVLAGTNDADFIMALLNLTSGREPGSPALIQRILAELRGTLATPDRELP